ncbi:MAG: porin family protein [Bacteroidota bacterium]
MRESLFHRELPTQLPLLAAFIFLLNTPLLWGQADSTAFRPQTMIGLQYGMSWNTVNFSPQVAQTTLQANRFGAAMRYTAQRHLGIQLEFAYDQRGWAETRDDVNSNYTRTIDYIEFAAFSHISIGRGKIRPVILLGSYLSYPIAQEEIIPTDPIWTTAPLPYYFEPLPERLQYGLAGGLGFELFFERISFQVDGRFRSALGGIFSSDNEDFFFSNSQGLTAQASFFMRVYGG